jgi:hypothetical protein
LTVVLAGFGRTISEVGAVLIVGGNIGARIAARSRPACATVVLRSNLSTIWKTGYNQAGFDFHERDVPPSSEELAAAWRQYVEPCIEAFGANRCMFESNFPPDKQSCGYTELWNAFKRITAGASAAEKTALYSGTAARVYRLTAL